MRKYFVYSYTVVICIILLTTMCYSHFQYPYRIGISDRWKNLRNLSHQFQPKSFKSSLRLLNLNLINNAQYQLRQRDSRSEECGTHEECKQHRFCSCHGFCHSQYGASCSRGVRDTVVEKEHYISKRDCHMIKEKKGHRCESSTECGCARHCSCSGFCVHSCQGRPLEK